MSETPIREFDAGPTSDADIPPGHPSAPPTLDELDVTELTELEQLGVELSQKIDIPIVTLPVQTRPGYAVRFSTDLSQADLDAFRKKARDKRRQDGIASERFASLILASKAVAIVRGGREVTSDGEPVTFRSRELLQILHAASATDAVAKLYGADAAVDATARSLLSEAGWGDDVIAEVDADSPTRAARG